MSDTAQLFILAGIWTLGALVVAYFIPKWPAKIIVVALLVGIPFWELPYGYLNFRALCKEQGGLRVVDTIAPQKSVCLKYPIDYLAPQFLAYGIQLVEAKDQSGKSNFVVKGGADSTAVSSKYCITQAFVEGLPWRIQRNEYSVMSATDSRVVARFSDFVWYGTWWQQAALPILGRGGECRHGDPISAVANLLIAGSK